VCWLLVRVTASTKTRMTVGALCTIRRYRLRFLGFPCAGCHLSVGISQIRQTEFQVQFWRLTFLVSGIADFLGFLPVRGFQTFPFVGLGVVQIKFSLALCAEENPVSFLHVCCHVKSLRSP
jgi:hypothetical protein